MAPSGGLGPERLDRRLRLLVLTDAGSAGPRGVVETTRLALEGGCRAIQLREKWASPLDVLELGRTLRRLTQAYDALLFVNDRVDVALAVGADGVHLGPGDLPVSCARHWAGPFLALGYSADDPEEARQAVAQGADYIGCGAVFGTTTKDVGGEAIGIQGLNRVARSVPVPVLAIGGVDEDNIDLVAGSEAAGAAVARAVMGAADPEGVTRRLVDRLG
ncbi:MAG TPA: thiamine phosphate synthase [Longimicrobiales bacterium]|nr:thiamine phosphate synthase [Longimicrobiales bacterium]